MIFLVTPKFTFSGTYLKNTQTIKVINHFHVILIVCLYYHMLKVVLYFIIDLIKSNPDIFLLVTFFHYSIVYLFKFSRYNKIIIYQTDKSIILIVHYKL